MPDHESAAEAHELREEIRRIREKHPYQNGYRDQIRALLEVLFFEYGQRPSAGRIVALLAEEGRSPSTGTAQDEINKFWERLRTTSKVKIQRPDVPPLLLEQFGQLASDLWQSATAQSELLTADIRNEATEQLRLVATERDKLQERCDDTLARLRASEAQRDEAIAERDSHGRALAAEVALRAAAETTAAEYKAEMERISRAHHEDSERASRALAAVQDQLERVASEQRRLLTVADDYKQAAGRDRAALEGAEKRLAEAIARIETAQIARQESEGEKNRVAGQLQYVREEFEKAKAERDRSIQTAAAEAAQLSARIAQLEALAIKQEGTLQRARAHRTLAVQRAWRYRQQRRTCSAA